MHLLPTGGTPQEVPEDLSGRHVVSTPVIGDPNFERTVIFILSFGDEGTLGVVLNRPKSPGAPAIGQSEGGQRKGESGQTDGESEQSDGEPTDDGLQASAVVQAWIPLLATSPPDQIFTGGPVSPETIIGIAAAQQPNPSMAPIRHAPGTFTVDLDQDPAGLDGELRHLRLFQGYAGWGPSQLEEEIRSGGWFVARATQADVFTANPEDLWSTVLERQPGSRRWFSLYPDSPASN